MYNQPSLLANLSADRWIKHLNRGGDNHLQASALMATLLHHLWHAARRHQLPLSAPTQACDLLLDLRIRSCHCHCWHCHCLWMEVPLLPANPLLLLHLSCQLISMLRSPADPEHPEKQPSSSSGRGDGFPIFLCIDHQPHKA